MWPEFIDDFSVMEPADDGWWTQIGWYYNWYTSIMDKNRTPLVCVVILYPPSGIGVVLYRPWFMDKCLWDSPVRIESFLKSRRQQMPTLLLRSMTCSCALITPPVCNHRGHFRFNGVCCKSHVGKPLWRLYHSLKAEIFRRIVHLVFYLKYWSLPRVHMGKWLGSQCTRNWGRLRPQILIF